jgi:hypothetical protein
MGVKAIQELPRPAEDYYAIGGRRPTTGQGYA